jgi:hypothetical protein
MKPKITFALSAAAAAALIAAGCGGGNQDANTTRAASSRAGQQLTTSDLAEDEWIRQADRICRKGDTTIGRAGEDLFGPDRQPSPAQLRRFVKDVAIPGVENELDQIRELGAPARDDDEIQAILNAAREELDKLKANPRLFASKQRAFPKSGRLAQRYGLRDCAQS